MTVEAPSEPKIQLVEGEIGVVNLGPNDRLVIMFPDKLTYEQHRYLSDLLKEQMPGVKGLILDSGAKVGVIHDTAEDA